jgi:hypothetical protein
LVLGGRVLGLLVSVIRDFLAGRLGVGVVIAVMYAGGNILEDLARSPAPNVICDR